MRTKGLGNRGALGFLGGLLLLGAGFGQTPPSTWKAKDIEAFLTKAPVVAVEKDVESGRTVPWRVTLDDGRYRARGLFRFIHRIGAPPIRHSYRYELAAYSLNRLLELEIVPPVIERKVEDTAGALQWYVENCLSERDRERTKKEPPELQAFLRRLDVIQVFEALVNDECGDKDDTLIHLDTWKVCRIDFAGAFLPTQAIASACSLQRCSRELFNRLIRLTRPTLVARLAEYLSPEEIEAILKRQQRIVERFKALIKEKGEAAVLFSEKRP
jgi:hypothetical protein